MTLKSCIWNVKKKQRERRICFPLLTLWGMIIDVIILTDRCCLYRVDHLQSFATCKMREREEQEKRGEERRMQTDGDTTGGSAVREPPLLSNEHRRQTEEQTTPYLALLAGNYSVEDGGIAKSYINTPHTRKVPIASAWKKKTELGIKTWKASKGKLAKGKRANEIGEGKTSKKWTIHRECDPF